jgi:hypothetical protein
MPVATLVAFACSFAPSTGKQRGTAIQFEVPLSCFHNPSTTPRLIPARKMLALLPLTEITNDSSASTLFGIGSH